MSKPEWLRIRPPKGEAYARVKSLINEQGINTVCAGARCPNTAECWGRGTATFMILGNVCTRSCRFCAVESRAKGEKVDAGEPARIAGAVKKLGLDYAVITSVDRDDLPDYGAGQFAQTIREVRRQNPATGVEVLAPDFNGKKELIERVVRAGPDVFGHNIEVVESLQEKARDARASYGKSLAVLEAAKQVGEKLYTKSSIMLGLGEKEEEVLRAMDDLREAGVDILTLGQYLRPGERHLEVKEWVRPEKFESYRKKGLEKGFRAVFSGPFVRSSYLAGEVFSAGLIKGLNKTG